MFIIYNTHTLIKRLHEYIVVDKLTMVTTITYQNSLLLASQLGTVFSYLMHYGSSYHL